MEIPEIKRNLDNSIDHWIGALEKYNEADLIKKPSAKEWSVGQVYMHLKEETEYFLDQVHECLDNGNNAFGEMTLKAKLMFANNKFPPERIIGDPLITENVPQPPGRVQLKVLMQILKEDIHAALEIARNNQSPGKTRHPGLGFFNAAQWLQYIAMHMDHHQRQKERINNFLFADS